MSRIGEHRLPKLCIPIFNDRPWFGSIILVLLHFVLFVHLPANNLTILVLPTTMSGSLPLAIWSLLRPDELLDQGAQARMPWLWFGIIAHASGTQSSVIRRGIVMSSSGSCPGFQ
ncbi:hypothetical protein BKA67DRAFT_196592 [Truncatella angustata]|uniref:Uncharacterized protein n=1 Tax=Truncatella angustata TaxID=152316 RepID=A0A9P8URN5_9PEZI|nr:uncharacterized protein BKA67DRAFT_196592 [Truncatella angustata]KAH6657730.1 hypothetical protein BKA67DRAFT_196592 [Truncatella angustata]